MNIIDPLYGKYELPNYLEALVAQPEVQRLRQIRLINSPSPSLPVLGEIRRFSHTLGVLRLSMLALRLAVDEHEQRALAACVLLHDIGTPPFAHLFEYQLHDLSKGRWNHEATIDHVLLGTHAPENTAHQIFAKRSIGFRKALKGASVDLGLVRNILNGESSLSPALFGGLDLDNLDNVARMAWALGIEAQPTFNSGLAQIIGRGNNSALALCREEAEQQVQEWALVRRQVYEILNFDALALASQAVLSRAMRLLVEVGHLTPNDWFLTDENLIDMCLSFKGTKRMISQEFFGHLPSPLFILQLQGTLQEFGTTSRNVLANLLELAVARTGIFEIRALLAYVIVDNGTFEKELTFLDPTTHKKWRFGKRSQSVILCVFVRQSATKEATIERGRTAYDAVMRSMSISESKVMYRQIGQECEYIEPRPIGPADRQHRLGF